MYCDPELIEVEISRITREALRRINAKISNQQLGEAWRELEANDNSPLHSTTLAA
jgi:hypothetical protein